MEDPKATAGPDVGTESVTRTPEEDLAALEAKADEQIQAAAKADEPAPAEAGAAPEMSDEDASVARVQAFMRKKGINDPAKIVEMAESLEKRNTQLDQDVRRLSAVGRFPAVGEGMAQGGARDARGSASDGDEDIVIPDNPLDLVMNPAKLKEFAKGLVDLGDRRAQKREEAKTFESLKTRVEAKIAANPEEWQKLRPVMLELSKQDPGADIDTLYDRAQGAYSRHIKGLASELRAELGLGAAADSEKLKGLLGRIRQQPVSSGTGVQVPSILKAGEKEAADILKAINDSDKF
jgi:hypothetical protein